MRVFGDLYENARYTNSHYEALSISYVYGEAPCTSEVPLEIYCPSTGWVYTNKSVHVDFRSIVYSWMKGTVEVSPEYKTDFAEHTYYEPENNVYRVTFDWNIARRPGAIGSAQCSYETLSLNETFVTYYDDYTTGYFDRDRVYVALFNVSRVDIEGEDYEPGFDGGFTLSVKTSDYRLLSKIGAIMTVERDGIKVKVTDQGLAKYNNFLHCPTDASITHITYEDETRSFIVTVDVPDYGYAPFVKFAGLVNDSFTQLRLKPLHKAVTLTGLVTYTFF